MTQNLSRAINGPSRLLTLTAVCALALTATACGPKSDTPNTETLGEPIPVVTISDVYKDIATAVGGNEVSVTALINTPNQDPHSYEASASDKKAFSEAKLQIENGGGYDDSFEKLRNKEAPTINVTELSGLCPPGTEECNEHVWYNLPTIKKLADKISTELAGVKRDKEEFFTANAKAFKDTISELEEKQDTIKKRADGRGVLVTEPVPLYLLKGAGLENKTPEELSEAIEADTDVPAAVMEEAQELLTKKEVSLLANNKQTETTQTKTLVDAAKEATVPVVDFTETLPEGKGYIDWMRDNLEATQKALEEKP